MLKDYEFDDDHYKPDELQNDGVVMLKGIQLAFLILILFNKLYIQKIAYTDFYDGAQLFHWKTCESWCFLTSIVNLPPAYRVKHGLEIEKICLWEGLFPDDQNSFQLHQIMDFVSSIPLDGSMLYAWREVLKNSRKMPGR